MLVRFRPKEIFRGLGVLVTASVVTFAIIWGLETKFNIFPFDINNNDQAIPWTHWVMMGMTERKSQMANRSYVGWYNPDSYKYTLSFEGVNERKAADLVKIREQYEDYGFWGYMVFLYRKMLYTWSDTTFFAPFLVNNTPVFWESEEFIGDRPEAAIIHKVIFDQSVGVMLFMYLCMIAGAIYNLVKGKNKLSYVFLAILGLLTFLLIWEDSSRYLITYYPLIVVCAMYGFNVIMNINRKSIKMSKAGSKNGKPKERKHAKRTNSLHSGAVL